MSPSFSSLNPYPVGEQTPSPSLQAIPFTFHTKEDDSYSNDLSPQLNPLQVVTTLHTPTFFYQLMYVFVHLNGISVKGMVDMGATHICLATSMAANLNLRIEPHASVIIPLNGTD